MALFRQGSTQYDKHTCITSQKTTNSKSWRKLITRFAPRSGQRLRKICYGKVEVLILFLLEFQQYMTYDQTFYLALMHYYSWTGKFYTCTCILFFCQKSYAGEPEFIFIECNAWWEGFQYYHHYYQRFWRLSKLMQIDYSALHATHETAKILLKNIIKVVADIWNCWKKLL